MAKRTPLERYQKLRKQVSAEVRAQIENVLADANKTVLALSDPNLSYDVRLEIYKSLQGWPRIVLGLYRAELAIAQNNRKENDAPEYGQEKPSEIAQRLVGDVIGLGPDRVRDLCKEGRRHLNQGMPSQGETPRRQCLNRCFARQCRKVLPQHLGKFIPQKRSSGFPTSWKGGAPGSRFFDGVTPGEGAGAPYRGGSVFAENSYPIKQ